MQNISTTKLINYPVTLAHFKNEHISNIIHKNKSFYEHGMLSYIKNNNKISKKGTYIDIGANIGNHSVYFSLIAEKVKAFEPIKDIFNILNENKTINKLLNLSIYNVGIGEEKGTYSSKINSKNMGSSTIYKDSEGDINVDMIENYIDADEKVTLIKIDVEDMCIEVIHNLKDLIDKNKPHLFIEANTTELAYISKLLNYKPIKQFNATPTYHMIPQ